MTTVTTAANPKKAPAKATPAKPAEKAAPTTPARLRWVMDEEGRKAKEPWPSSARTADGREYRITRGEGSKSWIATVTFEGKSTTLSDGSFGAAYGAVLAHHRAR